MDAICNDWWGNARDDGPEMAYWRIQELIRSWREICQVSPLAQFIPMPGADVAVAFPRIEKVILGHPTAILVRLRPGQIPADVEDYAPRIAYAMEAGDLRIRETGIPMQLRIEFLDHGVQRAELDIPHLPVHRSRRFLQRAGDGPDSGEAA